MRCLLVSTSKFIHFLHRPLIYFLLRTVEGRNNFPKKGPYILAPTHVSIIDALLLFLLHYKITKRTVCFLVKEKHYTNLFFRQWLRLVHTIPVRTKNPSSALNPAIKHLKKGGIIGIFPHGTRKKTSKVKTGMARLALSTNAPVIPITIKRKGLVHTMKIHHSRPFFGTNEPPQWEKINSWWLEVVNNPKK